MYTCQREEHFMKIRNLLFLLVLPAMLISCNKEPEVPTKGTVTVGMDAFVNKEREEEYQVTFNFDDEYFNGSAKTYSDNMKLLSFGCALASANGDKATNFYNTLGFDTLQKNYPATSPTTVGYVFAHKKINNYELVSIAIRGFDYEQEWANNFQIGLEGNHKGFDDRANEVLSSLKTYLNNYSGKDIKLWLTGFSRGGAIANVLASKVLNSSSGINVSQDNFFVYTFEAPRGLTIQNAIEYENVFNLINDCDLITEVPPEEYGLYRCGKDVVYNTDKDVDALVHTFDEGITLPSFTPSEENYTTHHEFTEYVMGQILAEKEDSTASLATRELFYNNYQTHVSYLMQLYFTLPEATINKITDSFKELSGLEIILLLGDPEGIYNFLKPILEEDQIAFDDEALHAACVAAQKLVTSQMALVLLAYSSEDFLNNLKRTIYMHGPEVVYALIK